MMDIQMALVCLAHRSVSRIYGPFIILKILTQIAKLHEKELQQVTKLYIRIVLQPRAGDQCAHRMELFEAGIIEIRMAVK